MGAGFLFKKDSVFRGGYSNLTTKLDSHKASLGLTDAEVETQQNNYKAFAAVYDLHIQKQEEAKSVTEQKNFTRSASVEDLQAFIKKIDAAPGMTDYIRADLGLTVRSVEKNSNEPVELTAPELEVKVVPGEIRVHFGTNLNGPGRNGKPKWAVGCNIYRKMEGESDYALVGMHPKSPYIEKFTGPSKRISYVVCYVAKDGRVGPQSLPANVAAFGSFGQQVEIIQLDKAA